MKRTPLKRKTPMRKIKPSRQRENQLYKVKARKFLDREENLVCPVMLAVYGLRLPTTQIHHKKGRVGTMLLNEKFWLAVSA